MHQTFEHYGSLVDVVVDGKIHPAQTAVVDAALDLILSGDLVARPQLRQERILAAAVWAPPFAFRFTIGCRSPDGPSAVPAEPFRLCHNRIRQQGGERIL